MKTLLPADSAGERPNRPKSEWKCALAFLAAMVLGFPAGSQAEDYAKLPIHDGDTVVVVGDSITVSGLYARLIDGYFQTRFPRWKVHFRNAGVNGYQAELGLAVIDADVRAWTPTVVMINYGMNDGRASDGFESYTKHIVTYVEKVRAGGARIILCSNSPLDIGDPPGKFTDFNVHFDKMANFAREYAAKANITFIDQFHFLHDLWGYNRERKQWIGVTWQSGTPGRPNDSVHPAPPGHLTMAYTILKGLGVPGEVSAATIDVRTGKSKTRRCAISDLKAAGREVRFVRTDEAAPCGIEAAALPGNELVPFLNEINSMPLKVTGLPEGEYDLFVADARLERFTAAALAEGINLGAFTKSPVYDPGNRALAQIGARDGLADSAREILKFQTPAWARIDNIDQQKQKAWQSVNAKVLAADEGIRTAAQPKPLAIRIIPAK